MDEIQEATIKVIAGPEKKSHKVTPKEKRLTAFHEAGHAVCTLAIIRIKVHQVSIIPRGMAGGYTMSLPEQDKSFVSKKEMEENIITLLGGRVAEQLVLDEHPHRCLQRPGTCHFYRTEHGDSLRLQRKAGTDRLWQ